MADIEGGGEWWVEVAEPPLLVFRDEERTDAFLGTFGRSLSVLAQGPGEVQIAVASGPFLSATANPIECGGVYEGAGWILAAERPVTIDERREPAPAPREGFPIPFSTAAEGKGMRIVPAPWRTVLVDRWSIDDVAALKTRGWQVQNLSRPVQLVSYFANGEPYTGAVASHLNVASWQCEIPLENVGLRLRKTYDRFHGRQRARVFVDGVLAGWWYEPEENRRARWHVSDFDVDPSLTVGRERVTITIDPPSGCPLWSVGTMETFARLARER